MKSFIRNFFMWFAVLFVPILIGTWLSGQLFGVIYPSHFETVAADVHIAAIKERCRRVFDDTEINDDFLNVLESEDEEGKFQIFAVYYRQFEGGDTNTFILVPDKETEGLWCSYLKEIRSKTAKEAELYQYTFSLQEDTIWVTASCREA